MGVLDDVGSAVGDVAGALGDVMDMLGGFTKAKLTVYEPKQVKTSFEPGKEMYSLEFDYNPPELSFKREAVVKETPTKKTEGAPKQEHTGPKAMNQTYELFYSVLEPTALLSFKNPFKDLHQMSQQMFDLCEAHPNTLKAKKSGFPPFVQFQWGDFIMNPSTVTDVQCTFTQFLPTGTPIRMSVKITLKEAFLKKKKTNPTSGSKETRTSHTVLAGETLASVAYSEMDDASLWRAIAEENGIDDPLRVRPGTVLFLPSLADG